jgi:hypothetical protein
MPEFWRFANLASFLGAFASLLPFWQSSKSRKSQALEITKEKIFLPTFFLAFGLQVLNSLAKSQNKNSGG